MALIRLTADNAEEVTQQVVGDFADLVRGAGKSPALTKLAEHAEELQGLAQSSTLEVEVILGEVAEQWVVPVAEWLQIDPPVLQEAISSQEQINLPVRTDREFSVVRIRSGHQPVGRRAGQRKPPILVVVHTPEPAPDKELKDAVFEAVQDHPLSLLLVPAEAAWAKALANLASRETWMCKAIGLELMAERNLEENLQLSPWKEARPLMVGWSAAGALVSLYEGLGLALEKERGSLKSKRTVLDQKAAVSQQKQTGNASDIIADARAHIQKQFDIYQKDSAKRMQSLVAQFDGTLSQEIESTIKAFSEFDYEKKPKIFVVRVPADLQNQLLARTKQVLAEAGRADLVAMGEMFRKAQEDVEKLVESKGGPPTVVHFHYLPDHELTNLLERSIGIQRPYQGTLARRGPMDYFMAARRYQMIFFMMFSAFGLSFVRSYRQIMVPLTVLLLSFGLLNVVNSTRKQEKETEELELEKARELLRAEFRRCMNEVDKNWSSILSNHLAAQQSEVLENIDSSVKSFFEGASRQASEDKVLQQRQLKGIDQAERKLTEADKKVQVVPQELEQLNTQIVQLFTAAVRPGEGGSRVPGAPGAAATPGVPRPAAGTPRPAAAAAGAAVPPAAAEALKKLQGGKAGQKATPAGKPGGRAGAAASDLKKKLAEARGQSGGAAKAATKPAGPTARAAPQRPKKDSGDLAAKAAKLKERAAAASSPKKDSGDLAAKAAQLKERAAAASSAAKSSKAEAAVPAAAGAAAESQAEDVHPKRAAVEERVAELQEKMKQAEEAGELDDFKKKAGDTSPAEADAQTEDPGERMRKKAADLKRKMAAAAEGGKDSPGDLDKTVMMPKPPPTEGGDGSD